MQLYQSKNGNLMITKFDINASQYGWGKNEKHIK